jgi:hypothetical protein
MKELTQALQPARADAALPLLVFLHLLKCHAESFGNLRLGQIEHHTPHANASTNIERAGAIRNASLSYSMQPGSAHFQ